MATKKSAPASTRKSALKPELPPTVYRVGALLQTMRCIAQHEDKLCILMNHIKHAGAVSAAARKELQALLEELPSHEYTDDLQAVFATLAPSRKSTRKPAS